MRCHHTPTIGDEGTLHEDSLFLRIGSCTDDSNFPMIPESTVLRLHYNVGWSPTSPTFALHSALVDNLRRKHANCDRERTLKSKISLPGASLSVLICGGRIAPPVLISRLYMIFFSVIGLSWAFRKYVSWKYPMLRVTIHKRIEVLGSNEEVDEEVVWNK
jgi:hypothetical protein